MSTTTEATITEIAERVASEFASLTADELEAMASDAGLEVDGSAVWFRPEDNKIVVFRDDSDDDTNNWAEVEIQGEALGR